jgi:hypothetical protein
VVEIGIFPAALVVATLALLAQFATMAFILIILLVTGNTFGWQLDLIDQPLFRQMTSIALGLPVLPSKRIVGVVIMIEVDLLPPLIVVAGLTLGTVTPLVTLFLVDFLMATITGQRCFLECLVFVTILALNISMFATKQ